MRRREFLASAAAAQAVKPAAGKLRGGVATSVITPALGASLAGYFTETFSTDNHDELLVKSLVLDNGQTRVALAVCDLCVLPSEVVAEARRRIRENAEVQESNVLIACTHTHSAPATMHVFQSRPDPRYLEWLAGRIADSVRMAVARLAPVRIGYGSGHQPALCFNRRYHMKPGAIPPNPFGGIDQVRTNPGAGNPDVLRPAGPVDAAVGVLAIQDGDGTPLCVVGNYSLHYVGGQAPGHVSADYFAYWAAAMAAHAGAPRGLSGRPFAAILTNGCQGDINNVDVSRPAPREPYYVRMKRVAETLTVESERVWKQLRYSGEAELGAARELVELDVRLPRAEEVSAARAALAKMPPPYRELPLVYARETVVMSETYPRRFAAEVQALRIGGLAIAGFSGEPFVELGLETRRRSPFASLFPVGLANGHAGYVPTVEAHEQGGYETWRAKTSFLEKSAAPKMTAAMLRCLESLAG